MEEQGREDLTPGSSDSNPFYAEPRGGSSSTRRHGRAVSATRCAMALRPDVINIEDLVDRVLSDELLRPPGTVLLLVVG